VKTIFGRAGAASLVPTGALAAIAWVHSLRTRGLRSAMLFLGLGAGAGAAGEYLAINVWRQVRHHTRPRIHEVPPVAVLSWYAITYGAFCAAERLRPVPLPVGAAMVATSLDLLFDCFGLDQGYWEWSTDGAYLPEIVGPNGRHGVPVANFVAWIVLTGGVSALYVLLGGRSTRAGRGALLLLPYYAPAAAWAVQSRRWKLLLYSALAPLAILRAARNGSYE
jgi:uncharacterized membrane protein